MTKKALFSGLVFDEGGRGLETVYVGEEPFYVLDDAGFKHHIPADQVDCYVLNELKSQIEGNEDLLSEQTAKMLGSEDIFSKALIENQLKHMDQQFDNLIEAGIPEESRAYMGMIGFRIVVDLHGEVVRLEQPSTSNDGDEGPGDDE